MLPAGLASALFQLVGLEDGLDSTVVAAILALTESHAHQEPLKLRHIDDIDIGMLLSALSSKFTGLNCFGCKLLDDPAAESFDGSIRMHSLAFEKSAVGSLDWLALLEPRALQLLQLCRCKISNFCSDSIAQFSDLKLLDITGADCSLATLATSLQGMTKLEELVLVDTACDNSLIECIRGALPTLPLRRDA